MDDVYVSCIKINGRPILPPVVQDERQREELRGYRDLAVQIELKIRERSLNLEVAIPEDLTVASTTQPVSPTPTDSTDLNVFDLDTSSEATFTTPSGRGMVRSASYTLDTPSQALLNSIMESDESDTSTLTKERRRSSIPKFTCVRKKSAKVATVYSPKRKRASPTPRRLQQATTTTTVETEEPEKTAIEGDMMENMIKNMRDEYELKLEMLRQQQEEEKAKLREEFLGQQHLIFQRLAINTPQPRPQSPPIKPERSPSIVVSKSLNELTATMAKLPLAALVRGYFVRRLHKTERVEMIKCAIKETLYLAVNLHEQPPPLSHADIELHGRLLQQLDQSLNELHSVFFEQSLRDRLKIIATDRERLLKGSLSHRSSNSRVSSATEKRQEMRKRSQQENLTPRTRTESKGRLGPRRSKSPKNILTESSHYDGVNFRQNKLAVPWR